MKKWGIKTRSIVERVEVVTPSKLCQKYPHLSEKIPQSTSLIEMGSSKKWQALFHDRLVNILYFYVNSLIFVKLFFLIIEKLHYQYLVHC